MTKSRDSRRRTLKACACALLLACLAFLVSIPFRRTVEFNIGDKTISVRLQNLVPNGPFSNEGVFSRTIWDGPTGSFSSGQIFGVKLGRHLLRLDIVDDPVAAARRRLPDTLSGLIGAVASNDQWLRFCAFKELAGRGASAGAALPALVAAMERGDLEAQDTLLIVSKAAAVDAVPVLANALVSPKAVMREKVAEILGQMGAAAKPAIPALVTRLNDVEPRVIAQSAYALWQIDGKTHGAVAPLISLLAYKDSEIRAGAAAVLGEFGDQSGEAVSTLIKALGDTNQQVRAMSARTLGMIGPLARSAIPLLIAQLDDNDHTVSMWTRIALRQFGEHACDAIPKLTELAMREDYSARWSIEALATMGTNAAPALAQIYHDARKGNRYFAAKSLIELGPKASTALPVLLEDLNGEHVGRARLAAHVVGHLGPSARIALPRLSVLLSAEDLALQVRSAGALWRLDRQTNAVLPVLMNALSDDSVQSSGARRFAAEELAEMGPPAVQAVPLLKAMLDDQQTSLHKVAAEALKLIAPNTLGSEMPQAKIRGRRITIDARNEAEQVVSILFAYAFLRALSISLR